MTALLFNLWKTLCVVILMNKQIPSELVTINDLFKITQKSGLVKLTKNYIINLSS